MLNVSKNKNDKIFYVVRMSEGVQVTYLRCLCEYGKILTYTNFEIQHDVYTIICILGSLILA